MPSTTTSSSSSSSPSSSSPSSSRTTDPPVQRGQGIEQAKLQLRHAFSLVTNPLEEDRVDRSTYNSLMRVPERLMAQGHRMSTLNFIYVYNNT